MLGGKKADTTRILPPNDAGDGTSDSISIRTKEGWRSIALSTTSSVKTRPEWRKPMLQREQVMILSQNIRYRLMALVLVLLKPDKESSSQSDSESLEKSLNSHTDSQSSKGSLTDPIANKVIEWGQTWSRYYGTANPSNIIRDINDWFNNFTASGVHNDVAVIIKSLIYDCFVAFEDRYTCTLKSLIANRDPDKGLIEDQQLLIAQIKKETQFANIYFDKLKNLEEQKKIYSLYYNVFQRLGKVNELVREFIDHYPQAELKNDTGETLLTKCSPCCCIQ